MDNPKYLKCQTCLYLTEPQILTEQRHQNVNEATQF